MTEETTKLVILLLFLLILGYTTALFEGDACVMQDPKLGGGKCMAVDKCDYAKKLLQVQKIRPQSCGFNRQVPLVCCPISTLTASTIPRSQQKCKEYHSIRNKRSTIARGKEAKAKEFPHMVALGYGNKTNIQWLCGGSLISDRFVLTAAHCAQTAQLGDPKWARLGALKLENTNNAKPQDIDIKAFHPHPDYKSSSHYNDIALIELQRAASFDSSVSPACIHTKKDLPSTRVQAIGWGKTDFFGDTSDHLLKVYLTVIGHSRCSQIYSSLVGRRLARGVDGELQICAGDTFGGDTCPGDSGGPIQFQQDQSSGISAHFVIVGVTSFGKGCGSEDSAGVYTRVSAYQSWIENIVWPV